MDGVRYDMIVSWYDMSIVDGKEIPPRVIIDTSFGTYIIYRGTNHKDYRGRDSVKTKYQPHTIYHKLMKKLTYTMGR